MLLEIVEGFFQERGPKYLIIFYDSRSIWFDIVFFNKHCFVLFIVFTVLVLIFNINRI